MSDALTLPRLGETMEEGRVVTWLKKPGDSFKRGETIVEIETDKTVVELPALSDGTLAEILVTEGTTVAVGTTLGRTAAAEPPQSGPVAAPPRPTPPSPPPPAALSPDGSASADSAGRVRTTPLARREARRAGLDPSTLVGTGRRGRVEAADVRAAAHRARPPGSAPDDRRLQLPQGRLSFRMWEPDGPARSTVLMLHGFAGDAQIWSAPAGSLVRAGRRVIAPDLPAHGETAIAAETLDDLVLAGLALADRLGLTAVDFVGHSMGAAVACRMARARPDLVRRLTLLAPVGLGGDIDGDFVAGMASVTAGGALAHLLRRLATQPPPVSAERLDAMAAGLGGRGRLGGIARALVADGRQQVDIVPDLHSIDRPIRILWGLEDRIIPWQHALNAPSHVARHFFRGAGHMLHWDQPEELGALLAAGPADMSATP